MIGGMMLLCAVGAMVLIAWWSLDRDDLPYPEGATGLLALRRPSKRELARHAAKTGQIINPEQRPTDRKRRDVRELPKPKNLNVREMNAIRGEIEEKGRGLQKREDKVGF